MLPTDRNEILNCTNKLKNKKSFGIDGIPNVIIQKPAYFIALLLCKLINLTLDSGIFPTDLKIVNISLSYIGGDAAASNNYRPVFLLPRLPFLKGIMRNGLLNILEFSSFFSIDRTKYYNLKN